MHEKLYTDAVELLKKLISTPSFSREETATADIVGSFLADRSIDYSRSGNNIFAFNKYYAPSKPTILLNSHHDTVKPNSGYTIDPFSPDIVDGKLYGLGSNDAGASVVSLLAAFLYLYEKPNTQHNLCIAITAEEEVTGTGGVESILPLLGDIELAIVGEPTRMNLAIAERGLMVLDCAASGKAGHAAREEGENAIYNALSDIEWFRTFKFEKESDMFGCVKMSVTVINAGTAHNVVPATCDFVVDVRITDKYSNEEVLDIIRKNVKCSVTPRSMRVRPSFISKEHPFVINGMRLGGVCYGSPTTSDQALIKSTSVKIGVGDSSRSHSANEFVYLHEISEGIARYIELIDYVF